MYAGALALVPLIVLVLNEPDRLDDDSSALMAEQPIRQLLRRVPLGTLAVIYASALGGMIVFFMVPVEIPFYLTGMCLPKSKKNKERIQAMVDAGKMNPAGMEHVEAARESGEWEDAYRLADDHEFPEELEAALRENEAAWENFQNYSNTDQHAFIAAVEDAKTAETKERRIERTVELAAQNLTAYDENNKQRL